MEKVIITGASRGLGLALAQGYLARGAAVIGISRTAVTIPSDGGRFHSIRFDLEQTAQLPGLMEQIRRFLPAQTSRVKLINSAAMLGPVTASGRYGAEDVARHFALNVSSPLALSSLFIGHFSSHSPAERIIVNITSGAAVKSYAGWGCYCASKAALEHYTRCVAAEQAGMPNPVRIYNFNPGVMDTEMQALIRRTSVEDFPQLERFLALQREGKLLSTQFVAEKLIVALESVRENGTVFSIQDLC